MNPIISHELANARIADFTRLAAERRGAHRDRRVGARLAFWRYFAHERETNQQPLRGAGWRASGA
jgi:hypothetical protein